MIKTKLYKASVIAKIVDGELVGEDCTIEYVSFDSREKSNENFLFIAIKGERYNGEDYIEDAINNGAKVIISTSENLKNRTLIVVKNTKEALFKWASFNKGNTRIIGVTGSVGKTTIKEMIFSVLRQKYKVCATLENHNNEIGVSQTLLSITNEDFCVVEMGMRGKGEIDFLAQIACPEIAVIGNVGTAHIERLGSKKAILKAKSEILNYTKKYALIPGEKKFKKLIYNSIFPIHIGKGGSVVAKKIKRKKSGIKYQIIDKNSNKKYNAYIHSPNEHDVTNSLFAFYVGKLCKVPEKKILEGIFEFKNLKNRGEILEIGKITIINDSYNSSPESLKSAIIGLCGVAEMKNKKAYAILGDMLEIGKFSQKYHIKMGEFLRKKGIFNIIAIGNYSRYICKGFKGGNQFNSLDEIIEFAIKTFGENDVVLLKASRRMHFEKIIEGLKEKFNEN